MDRPLFTFFDLAYDIRSFVLGMPGFEVISRDRKIRVVVRREPLRALSILSHFNYYMSFNDWLILVQVLILAIYYIIKLCT